ncbi:hypothetical protein [uncultured Arcticibacterium sp.]|uniref:hypothetical protein n=1 Tax=uncultured Arcticibacterium sp. TaxID=2173042 RepID=UPI0030F5B7D6
MAKLYKFILPVLVFLLSGFNSFSEVPSNFHTSEETLSVKFLSFNNDFPVKVGSFKKKDLSSEDCLIDGEEEEKEEELNDLGNHAESGNFITAFFYTASFKFSTDAVYDGTPVSERLSSNKRYIPLATFRI